MSIVEPLLNTILYHPTLSFIFLLYCFTLQIGMFKLYKTVHFLILYFCIESNLKFVKYYSSEPYVSFFVGECLGGFQLFKGKCYRLYPEEKNFIDAEKFCNNLSYAGHLASYYSEEEFNFLQDLTG